MNKKKKNILSLVGSISSYSKYICIIIDHFGDLLPTIGQWPSANRISDLLTLCYPFPFPSQMTCHCISEQCVRYKQNLCWWLHGSSLSLIGLFQFHFNYYWRSRALDVLVTCRFLVCEKCIFFSPLVAADIIKWGKHGLLTYFKIYDKLLLCVTYLITVKGIKILWHVINDKML